MLLHGGTSVRPELTYVIAVAARSICAFALRPVGTKAIDAALLLARGKMGGLYVDWDDPFAQPLIPAERVNEALAHNMFNAASRVIR